MTIYPDKIWESVVPAEVGFSSEKLDTVKQWLDARVVGEVYRDQGYRVVIVRGGRIVAEWYYGVAADARLGIASAAKSLYSCMLGIAVAEGVVKSADDHVFDYYPEFVDVPEGTGPKSGRYAFDKDRDLTFRQLICNVSGYMKPGEEPGKVFNYQTFGMNILCHAIATAYGMYDSRDPQRLPGCGHLIEEKIRNPIGATWTWRYTNFDLPPEARINIYGNYNQLQMTALDMARLGWLWRNEGRWGDRQVVPTDWVRQIVKVAPDIRAHCPASQWEYGHGFWTNEAGLLWPNLPRDSYAASGAGRHHIWASPSLDLVVVQSPGLYNDQRENDTGLLGRVVSASS
jgi:CubicO group peptidase (beta-lactamase class C family)